MAEIEGKAVAWLHVCNLFSFEVSAIVMTMACITPKRNRLAFEFCSQWRSSLVKMNKAKAPGEAGRKFALGRRSAVSHHAVDGHYACRTGQEPGGAGGSG